MKISISDNPSLEFLEWEIFRLNFSNRIGFCNFYSLDISLLIIPRQ